MKFLTHLCFVGVVAAGIALATPAHAQKIRTYGDTSSNSSSGGGTTSGSSANSGSGGAWYPGMPRPSSGNQGGQQAGQQQAGQQEGEGGEGGEELTGTYRINMYGGSSPGNASGPRTTLDLTVEKMYRGVIPGKRDEVDHLSKKSQNRTTSGTLLTWLGFQPEDTRTRIFIQTTGEADFEQSVNSEEKTMTLTLYNTELSDRNFSRFIDTSFFDRNIQRIEATEERGAVDIIIQMNKVDRPSVQQEGGYLYLDFPHDAKKKKKTNSQSGGQ